MPSSSRGCEGHPFHVRGEDVFEGVVLLGSLRDHGCMSVVTCNGEYTFFITSSDWPLCFSVKAPFHNAAFVYDVATTIFAPLLTADLLE